MSSESAEEYLYVADRAFVAVPNGTPAFLGVLECKTMQTCGLRLSTLLVLVAAKPATQSEIVGRIVEVGVPGAAAADLFSALVGIGALLITNPCAAAQIFHSRSCYGAFHEPPAQAVVLQNRLASSDSRSWAALSPGKTLATSLGAALRQRTTIYGFGRTPLTATDLHTLCWSGYGRLPRPDLPVGFGRTVPSAGALFPLELLVLVISVSSVSPGLYRADDLLEKKAAQPLLPVPSLLEEMFHTQHVLYSQAACLFVISGSLPVACQRYGERGYRFMLFETGAVSQNLALCACALNVPSVPVGAFDDNKWNCYLRDASSLGGFVALHTFVVGMRSP